MKRQQIKEILIAHGFKIPEGHDDLKPYVYEAVEAVLNSQWQPIPQPPKEKQNE